MGHIINPILYRIGVVYFWNSLFFSNKNFYDYLTVSSRYMYNFIKGYFKSYAFQHRWKMYLYNFIFIQYYTKVYVYLFFNTFKIRGSVVYRNYLQNWWYIHERFIFAAANKLKKILNSRLSMALKKNSFPCFFNKVAFLKKKFVTKNLKKYYNFNVCLNANKIVRFPLNNSLFNLKFDYYKDYNQVHSYFKTTFNKSKFYNLNISKNKTLVTYKKFILYKNNKFKKSYNFKNHYLKNVFRNVALFNNYRNRKNYNVFDYDIKSLVSNGSSTYYYNIINSDSFDDIADYFNYLLNWYIAKNFRNISIGLKDLRIEIVNKLKRDAVDKITENIKKEYDDPYSKPYKSFFNRKLNDSYIVSHYSKDFKLPKFFVIKKLLDKYDKRLYLYKKKLKNKKIAKKIRKPIILKFKKNYVSKFLSSKLKHYSYTNKFLPKKNSLRKEYRLTNKYNKKLSIIFKFKNKVKSLAYKITNFHNNNICTNITDFYIGRKRLPFYLANDKYFEKNYFSTYRKILGILKPNRYLKVASESKSYKSVYNKLFIAAYRRRTPFFKILKTNLLNYYKSKFNVKKFYNVSYKYKRKFKKKFNKKFKRFKYYKFKKYGNLANRKNVYFPNKKVFLMNLRINKLSNKKNKFFFKMSLKNSTLIDSINYQKNKIAFFKSRFVSKKKKKNIVRGVKLKKYNMYLKKKMYFCFFKLFYIWPHFMKLKYNFVQLMSIFYKWNKHISLMFLFGRSKNLYANADSVCDYIILKLLQKFTLKELMWPLLRVYSSFIKKKVILGYRFLIMGRLTRRDRAIYKWYKVGPMPLTNRISLIDYSNRQVALKYSLCSMKIWLFNCNKYNRFKKRSAIPIPLYKPNNLP